MEAIKRIRKRLGMSLADVAATAGMHREAVARAEQADVDPRASTVVRIADALGVHICELYGRRHDGRAKRTTKKA